VKAWWTDLIGVKAAVDPLMHGCGAKVAATGVRNLSRSAHYHPLDRHHLWRKRRIWFNATVDQVHVHDLHATLLHLQGFDYTKLTYRFRGRNFRFTDAFDEVVKKILA
jgi:hypothetical protein